MTSQNADGAVSGREAYDPPDVEQVGALPDLTFGAAPAVPIDTTFIAARPIFGVS